MGRGRQSEGSTAETARKRPESPWTAARTMEVLRRCPPRHCPATSALRICCVNRRAWADRVTRTMSVALLLRKNPKRKKSNFRSPAPPPYTHDLFWANLRAQLHLPPLNIAWNPVLRLGLKQVLVLTCPFAGNSGACLTRVNSTVVCTGNSVASETSGTA